MFSQLSLRISERMNGRKLASIVAQRTARKLSEKTVRNWLGGHTTPNPAHLTLLERGGSEWLEKHLKSRDWTQEDRDAFARELATCPGFVSVQALSLHAPLWRYPAFLRLAQNLDLLEQQLAERRAASDIAGWVQDVLDTPWLEDEHLHDPDSDTNAEAIRSRMRGATSWKELEFPLQLLIFNTQLELLATLDLEFCARYLTDFAPTPVFASLQPRLDPKLDLASFDRFPLTRNTYHHPTRRLLDVVACMCIAKQERKWPAAVPPVEDMTRWLDMAGQDKMASNLSKWRMGRTFTAERFETFWEAGLHFLKEEERPPAPMAMLYAASVFTELFVQGSREQRNLTFTVPDPGIYLTWWERQYRVLTSGPDALRFGSTPWMQGLG
jgi:hypothetical protein